MEHKDLLHLQCHYGLDTLCWARLGAHVTGADFSPAAIEQARSLAAEVGLDAQFVCSDVYDLPKHVSGAFDVVYTSRGVLGFANVFDDDEGVTDLRLRYPYFSHAEPLTSETHGSYADRSASVDQEVEYSWNHGMGEIVTALADAGLRLDFLHEFPFVEWPVSFLQPASDGKYRLPPEHDGRLPLFFSLKASRPTT